MLMVDWPGGFGGGSGMKEGVIGDRVGSSQAACV